MWSSMVLPLKSRVLPESVCIRAHVGILAGASQKFDGDERREQRLRRDRVEAPQTLCLRSRQTQAGVFEIFGTYELEPIGDVRVRWQHVRLLGSFQPHGISREPATLAGLTLTLSDGRPYPHKGSFVAADREVDRGTGTIRLAAAFANPGNVLRPGQYGRVRAVTHTDNHALVVPQRAVADLQGSYQIKVLGPGNQVSVRSITVGDRVGNLQIVKAGLKAGERVIVGAPPAVREGTVVSPKPFRQAED
jgi:hypothetical protein